MNITGNDILLLAHVTLGVLGTLSAVWVFVEALDAQEENAARTRRAAATAVAVFMTAAWIAGGYWYLCISTRPKGALILKGPWPLRAFNLHGNEGAFVFGDADSGALSADCRR